MNFARTGQSVNVTSTIGAPKPPDYFAQPSNPTEYTFSKDPSYLRSQNVGQPAFKNSYLQTFSTPGVTNPPSTSTYQNQPSQMKSYIQDIEQK